MRVFILGGTGTIGTPIVRELLTRGCAVIGLARSQSSAAALERLGASALPGDIRKPEAWLDHLPAVDGVIHAATDFADDMGDVDTLLLDKLLPVLGRMGKPRFVYTGGCWLYGSTGAEAAREASPFSPLPAFAWMVANLGRVLESPHVSGLVVHPAMVYDRSGGSLSTFIDHARRGGPIPVVGSAGVRWPLVHAEDLAQLYALVLERGRTGQSYNGVAVEGVAVGLLARAAARRYGGPDCAIRIISEDEAAERWGEWARGYAVDQSMSGERARRELGWHPAHIDPPADLAEIGAG